MAKATDRWRCASCGAPNDATGDRCRICQTARPGALRKQGSGAAAAREMPSLSARPAAPTAEGAPRPPAAPALPPTPAAPARVQPSAGPDRRVVIAAGVAIAVVAAAVAIAVLASGGDSTKALRPSETVGTLLPSTTFRPGPDIPTENVAAAAMLPTVADLGAGWAEKVRQVGASAFKLGATPSSALCVLPPPALPEAGARVDLGNFAEGSSVAAQVKVFPDTATASTDVAATPDPALAQQCLETAATADLQGVGLATNATVVVAVAAAEAPPIGEVTKAYRFTETITTAGPTLVRLIDLVTFRIGRTVGQLTVTAGLDQPNDALLGRARDLLTSRFVAQ